MTDHLDAMRNARHYVQMVRGTRLAWFSTPVGAWLIFRLSASFDVALALLLVLVGGFGAVGLFMSMSVRADADFERSLRALESAAVNAEETSRRRSLFWRRSIMDVLLPGRLRSSA
jgi:hypothetical protein